jgi:hypothetical protein
VGFFINHNSLHQSQLFLFRNSFLLFPFVFSLSKLPFFMHLLLVAKFLATGRHLNVVLVVSEEVRNQKQKKVDFVFSF